VERFTSDSAVLAEEYGIRIGRWTQYPASQQLPFDAMWCVFEPGSRSNEDCHPEVELAVVVSGAARFESPEGAPPVDAPTGSAVLLGSTERHVVVNASRTDPLVLLSVYWLPGSEPGSEPRSEPAVAAAVPAGETADDR
jgi:hypothetical protein